MSAYVCRNCGSNCDPVELVGGICIDCMEEERQRQIRATSVAKMMNSQSHHMELGLWGDKKCHT